MKGPKYPLNNPDWSKPIMGHKRRVRNALYGAASEALFVLLPFLILFIVYGYQKRTGELFKVPEWSFAATVLYGQSLVRLVGALAEKGGVHSERMGFVVSMVLVLGLCPSLITLLLILLYQNPSLLLCITQLCLCLFGFFTLFASSAFAAIARIVSAERR